MACPDGSNPKTFLQDLEDFLENDVQAARPALASLPEALSKIQAVDVNLLQDAVKALGNAVGRQEEWREPFGQSGVLQYICEQLDPAAGQPALAKQCLRVIGNSIADTEPNRRLIIPWLEKLVRCLEVPDLSPIAHIVLFNFCNDFEEGQEHMARLRVDKVIVTLLESKSLLDSILISTTELLFWATQKLSSAELTSEVYLRVLELALNETSIVNHQPYVTICLLYLQDQTFQAKATKVQVLERSLDLFQDALNRQAVLNQANSEEEDEERKLQEQLTQQLADALCAVSACDQYASEIQFDSSVVARLRGFLLSDVPVQRTCGCIMLGNLAVSDAAALHLVNDLQLHLPLIHILQTSSQKDLVFAAAGFVRHLAFPPDNRDILIRAGVIDAAFHLLGSDEHRVTREALGIIRKAVTDNMNGIQAILNNEAEQDGQGTRFSQLLQLAEKDTLGLGMGIEVGRTVVVILRFLHRALAPAEAETWLERMYAYDKVAMPLFGLAKQDDAILRSEGLLGLGLMAQRKAGTSRILNAIATDRTLVEIFEKVAQHEKKPDESEAERSLDRRNTVVMIQGLLTNMEESFDPEIRERLRTVQGTLSEEVMKDAA